nr:M20/M25/M40 family metallo-hydrolase [Pedobacter sp. L105]
MNHYNDNLSLENIGEQAIGLLKELIKIPSFNCREKNVADYIESFLSEHSLSVSRKYNNIWCYNQFYDGSKPTILLDSHQNTVKPNQQYINHPLDAFIKEGKLFGLGSNDAGGALVSLIFTFLYFNQQSDLPFNLCLAITGEEENSGERGIRCIVKELRSITFAIVGEPTHMEMAIEEKGLMVLNCIATGIAGHAAREEGINAIYKAIRDINWFSTYHFPIEEGQPDPVKMTVTQINAGLQHNIIPAECRFTVDIRFDHSYTQKEILNTISNHTFCEIAVRPNVLIPSSIDLLHPVVQAGLKIGRKIYSSSTSSDQAWLEIPSIKMGPGDSLRSHLADEFIYVSEVTDGIQIYIDLLTSIFPCYEATQPIRAGG